MKHPAAINLSTAASILGRGRKRGCAYFTGFFSLSTASLWTTRHLQNEMDARFASNFMYTSRSSAGMFALMKVGRRSSSVPREIINCSLSTFLELRRSRLDFRHLLRSALTIRVFHPLRDFILLGGYPLLVLSRRLGPGSTAFQRASKAYST